jgi:peroxiredoxin
MNRRLALQLTLIAIFAIVIGSAHTAASRPPAALSDPEIKFQGIDGHDYEIDGMRGNVMLVSFGATWCTPCTAELRALEELKREYAGKPVKFFWVSIEGEDQITNNGLKRYAKERKLTIPVLRDPSKSVYLQFSSRIRLPMILFFDKDGHVDAPAHFGLRSPIELYKADIRTRLNKLLG